MTETSQFERLKAAVLAASESRTWQGAVLEWSMAGLQEDPTESGICVCGQQGLVKLFTITNAKNGGVLFPIGSSCIGFFEREDLNEEISILEGLAKLRNALNAREHITLDADYFSRKLLNHFHDAGAFTPDFYNDNDGENDLEFLLTMFNMHNKDNITRPQRNKISVLLNKKVLPFVRDTQRIS